MSVEALPELAALASTSGTGLAFAKGEGTGNDFVLLPDREDRLRLTPDLVRRLCDRRFGIGADGCLRVVPGEPGTWFMDYVNADGSIAEMCGNGARVYARYLVAAGWARPGYLAARDPGRGPAGRRSRRSGRRYRGRHGAAGDRPGALGGDHRWREV